MVMRILITNDDGINSPALVKLAQWARKLGEVTVIAPKYEQSGKSHAIDFSRKMEIKKVDFPIDCDAWYMDSTPADCIRFAMIGFEDTFDLVLSGMNKGYNIGHSTAYSGTLGAACEATHFGLKAIAFSTDVSAFDPAFEALDMVYNYITENGLLDHTDILNVNIPDKGINGIRITRRGGPFYTDQFVLQSDGTYMHIGEPVKSDFTDLSYDLDAVMNGYVSITPMSADKTDLIAYEKIKF
jgi:5'-nucleotidase